MNIHAYTTNVSEFGAYIVLKSEDPTGTLSIGQIWSRFDSGTLNSAEPSGPYRLGQAAPSAKPNRLTLTV